MRIGYSAAKFVKTKDIITDMQEKRKKLLWFFGLWVASVATLAIISYAIKLVIGT